MKKVDVALTYPLPAAQTLLAAAGLTTYTWPYERRPNQAELSELATSARALLTMLTDKIDTQIIESAAHLKVIANNAVGFNNIDLAACERARISVCNTPGVLTQATADLALALILDVARNVSRASMSMRQGNWTGWNPKSFVGRSLTGKTLGIVGMGRIGSALAQKAHLAFEMKILYSSRAPKDLPFMATHVPLETLLKESDFVSLHCPLNEKTKGLIDAQKLALMKSESYLINTARGEIVVEADLIQALASNKIAGAGLDVFEREPLPLESELFKLDNVSLTPHIGSADQETRRAMAELAARNIIDVLRGEKPVGEVLFFK